MTPESTTLKLVIPGLPPSNNHYKKPDWAHRRFYVTSEARSFKGDIAIIAQGACVEAKAYEITLRFYFGRRQRLDGDNGPKVVFDGLVEAGVIHSDAAIQRHVVEKYRDWANPRTEIVIQGTAR
jgi:Holliday junction resolvase RusA-like endonuclease